MMAFGQTVLLYVVGFLAIIGPIIVIHEFGHFLTAKWFGVAIDRFSIGFGRAIFSRTDRSGVEWRIGWIPLGGYVRFAGDDNDASVPDADDLEQMRRRIVAREGPGAEKKYLPFKPLWQRAIIVAAGPIVNFLTAIAVFAAVSMIFGDPTTRAVVSDVTPGSAAQAAGFRPGDQIIRAGDTPIRSYEDLTSYVVVRDGRAIPFLVERDGRQITIVATPRRVQLERAFNMDNHGGRLGLGFQGRVAFERKSLPEAVVGGVERCWTIVKTTVFYIGRIFTGQVSGDQIGGPIQMVSVTGSIASATAESEAPVWVKAMTVLLVIGFISVSVGFFNLLPIPALDGGHLLFYAYEAVARRPLGGAVQAAGYRVGLALLLCLMLFATWNDLQRLRVFQSLGGLFS